MVGPEQGEGKQKPTPKSPAKPDVRDPKLKDIADDLYKGAKNPNRTGSGSTADAVREELRTGEPTEGKFHSQKAQEYVRALDNWLQRNPNALTNDRDAAQMMKQDLVDALKRTLNMQDDTSDFARRLVKAVPELEGTYHEHLHDNGELLPHVFMGSVARVVIALAQNSANESTLCKIMKFLEDGYELGRDDVKELISVSFLENLDQRRSETFSMIQQHFGNNLKKEAQIYGIKE